MSNDTLLCKNCKHSFVPTVDKIFSFGFPSEYMYKCKKLYKEKQSKLNPVIGEKIIRGEYTSCSSARSDFGVCGPRGKLWSPKHKRDLFKMLTKDEND